MSNKENQLIQVFREVLQPKEFIKTIRENSILFWLLLLAFCCGFFLASQYYEMKCNIMIDETIEEMNQNPMYSKPIIYADSSIRDILEQEISEPIIPQKIS